MTSGWGWLGISYCYVKSYFRLAMWASCFVIPYKGVSIFRVPFNAELR